MHGRVELTLVDEGGSSRPIRIRRSPQYSGKAIA
jgi:hypothetical protein